MLPDRNADAVEAWLHRDRSGAYAEAVRRALPDAIQVAGFAGLIRRAAAASEGNDARLGAWITAVRAASSPTTKPHEPR